MRLIHLPEAASTALDACIAELRQATDALDHEAALTALHPVADRKESIELWSFAIEARARHALTFGQPVHALTYVMQARERTLVDTGGMAADSHILAACGIDALIALGEANRALRAMDDIAARMTGELTTMAASEVPWLRVQHARLYLIGGVAVRARELAAATMWAEDLTARERAELLLIHAAASFADDRADDAHRSFGRAWSILRPHGILQPFRTIGAEALRALWPATGERMPERLAQAAPIYPEPAGFVELTGRELEVLYRLVEHESAQQIAQVLVVSPNTVKKQLNALYAKLDVHTRASALLAARRLGFLPRPAPPGRGVPSV